MTYKSTTKKKNRAYIYIIILVIVMIIGGLVTLFYYLNKKGEQVEIEQAELHDSLKRYFEQKNFLALIEKIDTELKREPFTVEYLLYRGYSYFSLGEQETDLKKKRSYFLAALVDLRRTMAIGVPQKNKSYIYLCLGKIYYYFGQAYYRLSLDYLNRSAELDPYKKDIHYMLGVVYDKVGDYKNAIKAFSQSLKIEETDILLLAIGRIYYKDNDYENATKYLLRTIQITNNARLKEKALSDLGEMNFNLKRYDLAMDYFDQVLEINDNNANVHFYRGEIYYVYNDKVKARAQWRKASAIDPSHIGALKRLY